jgi:hypothetical protein
LIPIDADKPTTLCQLIRLSIGPSLRRCQDHQRVFEQSSFGEMTFAGAWQQRSSLLPPTLKQVSWDALVGHFATGWQRTLPPDQATVMAYTTTEPDYTLRVTIEYEDETGYQWRRINISQPKRIG